jgi:hypothetical protein
MKGLLVCLANKNMYLQHLSLNLAMAGASNRFLIFMGALVFGALSLHASSAQTHPDSLSNAASASLLEEERQLKAIAFFALIPVVVAFSFTTFVFYRKKREALLKEKEAALKLTMAEVELKALKAQINPHFIFNCMNSIHHYMHGNDIRKASDYLIKFSQLIRLVLENSSLKSVTLNDEIQTLQLYVQLEQLRLDHKFTFTIDVDPSIDKDECEMPGFLIQPFVENAIWHELSQIEDRGQLSITIVKQPGSRGIVCTISSEGVGRREPQPLSEFARGIKKTSMGLNLVRERIDLLNRTSETKALFVTKDISEPAKNKFGHCTELIIPVIHE